MKEIICKKKIKDVFINETEKEHETFIYKLFVDTYNRTGYSQKFQMNQFTIDDLLWFLDWLVDEKQLQINDRELEKTQMGQYLGSDMGNEDFSNMKTIKDLSNDIRKLNDLNERRALATLFGNKFYEYV